VSKQEPPVGLQLEIPKKEEPLRAPHEFLEGIPEIIRFYL